MNHKEELRALRGEIDGIDAQLVGLFRQRMEACGRVARVKDAGNLAIVDNARERQVVDAALALVEDEYKAETVTLMRTLMALSKLRQNRMLMARDAVPFPAGRPVKKDGVKVGFQGVNGAWGQQAAERLFPGTETQSLDYFETVFEEVKAGTVDYGVLPIENSQTGAIGEVYDLLRRHSCYIVGEIWVAVAQCLLAYGDTALTEIREVYSHPEGFNQCRRFLKNKSWDLTACRNTAYAAQMAAQQKSGKYAAIGSRKAAQVYGLTVLAEDIVDNPNNRTRFIAIAAEPEYDADSSITSITFSTAHKSGALCAVLEAFMLAGINLSRIESRPVSADKYRFFADLQANVMSEKTKDALNQASAHCDYFEILGCYGRASEL